MILTYDKDPTTNGRKEGREFWPLLCCLCELMRTQAECFYLCRPVRISVSSIRLQAQESVNTHLKTMLRDLDQGWCICNLCVCCVHVCFGFLSVELLVFLRNLRLLLFIPFTNSQSHSRAEQGRQVPVYIVFCMGHLHIVYSTQICFLRWLSGL